MRLDKLLADSGLGTRSEVKKYIKAGRISIEGKDKVTPDVQVEPSSDIIYFDGNVVEKKQGFRYYILNKPQGVITATEDKTQKTVLDLLPKELRKNISPVGRLDKDTEGLLLLTDDGQLSHRLLSPKHHVEKKYLARVDGMVSGEHIEAFEKGLDIGDDKILKPAGLEIISASEDVSEVLVTITEGRYHQIKRMFLKFNLTVIYLKRLSMGILSLPEDLKCGEWREIDGYY